MNDVPRPPAPGQPTAFISHSSADHAMAMQICDRLEEQGVKCWIAPRNPRPSKEYTGELAWGIDACSSFVLLATSNSLVSTHVKNELERAHRLGRPLYTVMVNRPKLPDSVEFYLARLHWLPSNGSDLDSVSDRLASVMNGEAPWERVATAPHLSRPLRHMLPAFASTLVALLLVLACFAAVEWHYFQRGKQALAVAYQSIGWVEPQPVDNIPGGLSLRVFMGNADLPFGRTELNYVSEQPQGLPHSGRLTGNFNPQGTGVQAVPLTLPPETTQLETFFAVPSAGSDGRFCVHQKWSLSAQAGARRVDPLREPVVRRMAPSAKCE